jgi:fermentation-respiration switch protein FrsA (DUF1100 family)
MSRRDVEFNAEGPVLRGWFYQAETSEEVAPVVVMAHGLSAVKEMCLDEYALAFSAAGLHALVYDHRNFGASDGEPRQEVDPIAQCRDLRHAITYAMALPEVDADRVGVWGTSFSGGHALSVAAADSRVKAVAVQVPFVSGHDNIRALVRADFIGAFEDQFVADRESRFRGQAPATVPVVDANPMAPAVLPSEDSWRWFTATAAERAPSWRNEITVRSVEMLSEYEPRSSVQWISPTPLLMVLAENDVVAPSELAFAAYQLAREPKHLVVLPGGHFDAYHGAGLVESAGAARDHFVRYLIG